MKVIDTHMHINAKLNDLKYAEAMVKARHTDAAGNNIPLLAAAWLLSLNSPHSGGDDLVIRAAKAFPDFYIPFGHLDFTLPPSHLDDLKDQGFVGLKAIWPPASYDDESLLPYYEIAEKNRMPIVFHTSGSVYNPGEYSYYPAYVKKAAWGGRYMYVGGLDLIAKLFPKLILIAAHLGVPNFDDAISIIKGHKNVYGDISSAALIREMNVTDRVVRNFKLEDKLLFGVDTRYHAPQLVEKYRNFWDLYLSQNVRPEVHEKIMGLNALKIIKSLK